MLASQNLPEKIVECALAYKGKLQHVSTGCSYVSFDIIDGSVANDFMLLFCKSLGDIPETIKKEVTNRYQQAKSPHLEDGSKTNQDNLRMCCWDFCFLVLFDAGIVNKEELDAICSIVNMRQKYGITIAHALYNKSLEEYPNVSIDNMPLPGDILLFKRKDQNRAWHTAIAIDAKGHYIDLNARGVTVRDLSNILTSDTEHIRIIPAHELKDNIKEFIQNYQYYLGLLPYKVSSNELSDQLKYSQYECIFRQERMDNTAQLPADYNSKRNTLVDNDTSTVTLGIFANTQALLTSSVMMSEDVMKKSFVS